MPYLKPSTTQYRWMTDAEFINLIEQRLGRSPILDELHNRLLSLSDDYQHSIELDTSVSTGEFLESCPVCDALF